MFIFAFIVSKFADHSFVLQALETLYIVKKIGYRKTFDEYLVDEEILQIQKDAKDDKFEAVRFTDSDYFYLFFTQILCNSCFKLC